MTFLDVLRALTAPFLLFLFAAFLSAFSAVIRRDLYVVRLAGLETGHVVVPVRRRDLLHSDPVLDLRSPAFAHGQPEYQHVVALCGECASDAVTGQLLPIHFK